MRFISPSGQVLPVSSDYIYQSINQSISQSINQSIYQSILSITHCRPDALTLHCVNKCYPCSLGQSINQLINQSINQSIYLSINLSINPFLQSLTAGLCDALASHRVDKCYPCPLVDGDYSTRTGMLLRDTFQPLLHQLRELQVDSSTSQIQGNLV